MGFFFFFVNTQVIGSWCTQFMYSCVCCPCKLILYSTPRSIIQYFLAIFQLKCGFLSNTTIIILTNLKKYYHSQGQLVQLASDCYLCKSNCLARVRLRADRTKKKPTKHFSWFPRIVNWENEGHATTIDAIPLQIWTVAVFG